jgi:adenylate kinase
MKLVLIGIQGAGKSTQGNLLSQQLKIPYLSTGHIFREIAKETTPLGKNVKLLMTSGKLIPDDEVIEIVNSYLSKPGYKRGYILDGFPRTLAQAKKFSNNVDRVIEVHIPDKEALWRLAYRNEKRDDDTIEAIKKRIELFKKFTQPVLDYYKKEKKLIEIDGTQSVKEVNDEILKSLGKQVIANQVREWEQKGNTLLAIVGMPGSGKTEAAQHFKKLGLPIISFSEIVKKTIERKKLPDTLEVHHNVRQELRDKYGYQAMALLSHKKILEELKKHKMVVLEGMRSWEEYEYLKKEFPESQIFILALHVDKQKRYSRIKKRKERSQLGGEGRDLDELIQTHMGPTIAYADYLIKNNFSLEELYHKLDEVYREIYYL